MKKDSALTRYKDPKNQILKIRDYNKRNYKGYNITLHKEKDAEMIYELDNSDISKTETVRKWFSGYKSAH